ncbi:MAG TPA: MerR family transcriptional regulator [Streptosporangiaceae bacterium]|nr:MerR family transcriptional regulator [Streptosporangiaceae bacterium]
MPSLPLDDENLPLFTVGQVSTMLEIQQAFLRRLDEHRVVRPSRSSGGQRRYTRREISLVQYVVELVNDGMTLTGIRRVLELEARVSRLEAERSALLAAVAERDRLLSQRLGPSAQDVLPSARDGSPSAHDRSAGRDHRPPG